MRISVGQLRRIIKEEAAHALSGSSVDPSKIKAMDEAEILKVVAGIGAEVQGLSRRRAQVSGFAAVGKDVESAAELAAIVEELEEQCTTLQVCVQVLKGKSQTAGVRAKYPQLKQVKPEPGGM